MDEIMIREKENANKCFVYGHFTPDKFDSIDYGNDCSYEKYQVMLGLERMHRDGVPLLRGNMLPKKYQLQFDVSEDTIDFVINDEEHEDIGNEEGQRNNTTSSSSKTQNNNSIYTFLVDSFSKDMAKAVADDLDLQNQLRNSCNKLVSEFEGKKRMKMNKTVPSSSKLVSSCAETEVSKTHGRLKRKHEYMKKK